MSKSRKVDPIQGEILHEYDGIEEADNQLPTWWLWTLFAAVAFSIGYWFYYEAFKAGPGLAEAYYQERALQAEKNGSDPTDGELLAQLGTPSLRLGQGIFESNCVACHEAQGQGKIGPNLTDNAWLHGGTPAEIYRTIRDGVSAKGMPAWGPALGRAGVIQATTFVLSLRDKNLPGKAPEGQALGARADIAPAGDEH
ncbi:MAG: cbb3-type cytochrome c oxidase N-terminal domain-containing protein [Myxococcales bacterium]